VPEVGLVVRLGDGVALAEGTTAVTTGVEEGVAVDDEPHAEVAEATTRRVRPRPLAVLFIADPPVRPGCSGQMITQARVTRGMGGVGADALLGEPFAGRETPVL
jgi:hypothetical protein